MKKALSPSIWKQGFSFCPGDHDWSRTSTSEGHYPLKVARLPIPPRGLYLLLLESEFQKRVQR